MALKKINTLLPNGGSGSISAPLPKPAFRSLNGISSEPENWTTGNLGYVLPDNYIYISHLDEDLRFWRLPDYPEVITDRMSSTFQATNALGRSAPVYTYSNSGPRTVQIGLKIHRDMMDEINSSNKSYSTLAQGTGEDWIENLINALRAIALPKYNLENKAVEPPLVALRLGREVFIKGVVIGEIGLSYEKPILSNNKYAQVNLSLQIAEVDPYDATTVYQNGGYRGEVNTFRAGAATIGIEDR